MHHDHPRAVGDASVVVIVLTGGSSRRMGRHKPALEVAGLPMVERVVDAARPRPTVVVGSRLGVPGDITTVADDCPGGGPVAGLAAGVRHLDDLRVGPHGDTSASIGVRAPDAGRDAIADVAPDVAPDAALDVGLDVAAAAASADLVIVLAGDLPFVTSAHLDRLVVALRRDDAAVAVTADDDGQRNWLCAVWRVAALRERLAALGDPVGQSMRRLAGGMLVTEVSHRGEATDVDTPDELDRARRRAEDDRRRE